METIIEIDGMKYRQTLTKVEEPQPEAPKEVTYEDVMNALWASWWITPKGSALQLAHSDHSNYPTQRAAEQAAARIMLENVAAYVNEGRETAWDDDDMVHWLYYFVYNGDLSVKSDWKDRRADVYFVTASAAERALDILGEETIKRALGVFE